MKNKIEFFNKDERLLSDLEMIALVGTGISTRQAAPEVKNVDGFENGSFVEHEAFNDLKKVETLEEDMKQKGMKREKVACKTSICKRCSGCKLHLKNTIKSIVS